MTLVTVEEFAKLVGAAASTIRSKCKDRKLPSTKIGVRWFINKEAAIKQLEKATLLGIEKSFDCDPGMDLMAKHKARLIKEGILL